MASMRTRALAAATWPLACVGVFLAAPQPAHALAAPTIAGQASTPALVGGSMTDSATLAGGDNPTGSITFSIFVTNQCSGAPIFTSTKTVNGNGTYLSDAFGPLVVSTFYSWQANYSGDANNNAVATIPCDGAQSVAVPEYCPPHSCTLPKNCGPGTVTASAGTISCPGATQLTSVTTVAIVGPAIFCNGPQKSMVCSAVSGGIDFNTITEYYGDLIFADGYD